jgi:DNA repair exonuclease SbcCD ATPase subunit
VGQKRTGRSGRKTEPVYGWVHYPEHIAPRDQAQHMANVAAQDQQVYQQLAIQAQQQADKLKEQAQTLQARIKDWPILKQGILYEIQANEQRLQAYKDLLNLNDPIQRQKLETLQQQIQQTETELNRLNNEKLPNQQQLTDETERRLQEKQAELEASQKALEAAHNNLQNILELSGFLLPYRERFETVQKQIKDLLDEKVKVEETIAELAAQLVKTPSDRLSEQLQNWRGYLKQVEQELAWGNLQKDQLAMAIADSPERLKIAKLIKELETAPESLNPKSKIENLKSYESGGANFLQGFDNLEPRLTAAKTEQAATEKSLAKLQEEYRQLGLAKDDLEKNKIPAKQKEIEAKEKEIAGMKDAIAQTTQLLNTKQAELSELQNQQAQKGE